MTKMCELCGCRLFFSEEILCLRCVNRRNAAQQREKTDIRRRWNRLKTAQKRLEVRKEG